MWGTRRRLGVAPDDGARDPWNDPVMQMTGTGDDLATGASVPRPGWVFDLKGRHSGGATTAEILEVLHVPGYQAYCVRFDDGSVSTFIPSSDHHPHPPDGSR
jgi:hypothetical protein